MSLEQHQRGHLFTTYLATVELLDEVESIARGGRTSAASGTAMAPLPDEWWERVAAPLARARERLRVVVAQEAPEELRAHEAMQPLSATMRWLSILLLRLDEEVDDLDPARLERHYGPVPQAAAEELTTLRADLARELARAREELDRHEGGRD